MVKNHHFSGRKERNVRCLATSSAELPRHQALRCPCGRQPTTTRKAAAVAAAEGATRGLGGAISQHEYITVNGITVSPSYNTL